MIKWFKSFFKKKILLPVWFGMLPGRAITPEQEEYYETINKVSNYLVDNPNNTVYLKIDNVPAAIYLENGDYKKLKIRKLEPDEYKYEF